jgi:hypothetical protein
MTNTKILTGISLLTLAGMMIVPVTNAYRGDTNVQGPNYSAERHEAMTNAFENQNYNEWKNQMQGRGRVTEVVNEKNFAKFAQAHKLMLEGKTEEANQIRQELGLGLHDGSGYGSGQHDGQGYGRNK